jgi:hypothetical protein
MKENNSQNPNVPAIQRTNISFLLSLALYVAAKVRLGDCLKDGPLSVATLAESLGANRVALYRLLRALASVGVFSEIDEQKFALTPLGEYLRMFVLPGLGDFKEPVLEHWGARLLQSVRTGLPAFDRIHGKTFFDYIAEQRDRMDVFQREMADKIAIIGPAVLRVYDFARFGKVVDVGGGCAALMRLILEATPGAEGMVFEMPDVAAEARKHIVQWGLAARCETAEGDFFTNRLPDGDVLILASIVHDWNDEMAVKLLKNCRRSMSAGQTLLLIESVITPGDDTPFYGKFLDLAMLMNFGGRERTEREFCLILQDAGFRLQRVIPTNTPWSILEAIPAV